MFSVISPPLFCDNCDLGILCGLFLQLLCVSCLARRFLFVRKYQNPQAPLDLLDLRELWEDLVVRGRIKAPIWILLHIGLYMARERETGEDERLMAQVCTLNKQNWCILLYEPLEARQAAATVTTNSIPMQPHTHTHTHTWLTIDSK
jgi:hypothetical protein